MYVVKPVVQVCAAGRGEQRERTPEDCGILSTGQPLFSFSACFTSSSVCVVHCDRIGQLLLSKQTDHAMRASVKFLLRYMLEVPFSLRTCC